MQKLFSFIFLMLSALILMVSLPHQMTAFSSTIERDENIDAVYFGSRFCDACAGLESDGVLENLELEGFVILKYYLEDDTSYISLLRDYQFTHGLSMDGGQVPVLFFGSTYLMGRTDIREAYQKSEIQNIMLSESLPPLLVAPIGNFSLIYFILLGLADGVNPCAIAMLLMFISLLSFTKRKRVMLFVSLTFISAIFISYFLFGTLLFSYLSSFGPGTIIVTIVPWIILGITAVLFLLNTYDFIIALLKRYDKIKNQLPNRLQKFNKNLMAKFTKKMDEGSPMIYLITFFIGVIISFTEFLCTGQAYLTAILHLIHLPQFIGRGILLLLFYNLIFVLPLLIITLIAVKTQSIVSVSNFMREKLHLIKLFNALIFLAVFIYYLFYVL